MTTESLAQEILLLWNRISELEKRIEYLESHVDSVAQMAANR